MVKAAVVVSATIRSPATAVYADVLVDQAFKPTDPAKPALVIVPNPRDVPATRRTCPSVPVMSATSPAVLALLPTTESPPDHRSLAFVTPSVVAVALSIFAVVTALAAMVAPILAPLVKSLETLPVTSPVRANDLAEFSFVAVLALPVSVAVIVPASKLPLASRATILLAPPVLDDWASTFQVITWLPLNVVVALVDVR